MVIDEKNERASRGRWWRKKKEWGIAGPKGWDQVDTVECECAVASEKAFSVLSFFSSSHFLRYILHVEIYGSE